MERTEVAACISKKELSTTEAIQSLSCPRKRCYTNNNPKMTILIQFPFILSSDANIKESVIYFLCCDF